MKKSLLAFALLGMGAGMACAQSNVTIYGAVDLGITNENNGAAAGSVTRMDSGIMNGSRLGFKGSEDLGGGMAAIFTLENGFSADTGVLGQGGLLFGRQAWIGMKGGFGTVTFGRQNTFVYANSPTFDPFIDALAGDTSRLFNYAAFARANNSINYSYALPNGIRADLQYGFGEVAGNTSANSSFAFDVAYKGGPVDVILTHNRNKDATGNITGKSTLIGGNYDFGMLKAYAAYQWNKDVSASQTAAISNGADVRVGLIGVRAPVGAAGTVMASYIRLSNKAAGNADASQAAIGYMHELSKRTALYASYGRLANDANAGYMVPAAGLTDRLLNVGIRHWF